MMSMAQSLSKTSISFAVLAAASLFMCSGAMDRLVWNSVINSSRASINHLLWSVEVSKRCEWFKRIRACELSLSRRAREVSAVSMLFL